MRKITRGYIHHNGKAGRSIDTIRRYHTAPKPRGKGWSDIGYHFVLHGDASWHVGRSLRRPGAGVKGDNTHSVHICVIMNGNTRDMSCEQQIALMTKMRQLTAQFPGLEWYGHREANQFLPKRLHTRKQCPGTRVDMDFIRRLAAGSVMHGITLEGDAWVGV